MLFKPINNFYIANNQEISTNELTIFSNYPGNVFYEVVRIVDKQCLFLEDHLVRLKNSLTLSGIEFNKSDYEITNEIYTLIKLNNYLNGNIAIQLFPEGANLNLVLNYIDHKYPKERDYKNGIKTRTLKQERQHPHIKQTLVKEKINQSANLLLKEPDIFEVILVDSNNYVTEGTKSNIFFVKDREVYTSDASNVLEGITRKHILNICMHYGLKLNVQNINLDMIEKFDSAFLSGTSPKILPISAIDQYTFVIEQKIMQFLIDKYNELIDIYIKQKNREFPV